jgi:hypothetical protein
MTGEFCVRCGNALRDEEGYWWKVGDEIWDFCIMRCLILYRDEHPEIR